jgi:DNA repair protein RadC
MSSARPPRPPPRPSSSFTITSGDPAPRDDSDLTTRLAEAGHLMGIEVLDHLILGDGRYFSFKEAGRL